jgi:muconolactone delta-isomerase
MDKFQVTISFSMDDRFMELVPAHRVYINLLIEKNIIENYAVSMDTYRSWILFNANTKEEVMEHLRQSPLFAYWTIDVDRLFVYDGSTYRLPDVVLN